jgi:TolB-like protein
MKKTLGIGIISLLLVTAAMSAQEMNLKDVITRSARGVEADLPQDTMVAVLNFVSPAETFSNYIIEELTGELVSGRKLAIVDRQNLALISKEMDLQLSGDVSDESAQSIGRLLGAQAIISGSVTNMGTYHRFRIRVISVETARILTQVALDLQNDAQVAFLLGGSIENIPPPAPAAAPPRRDRPAQSNQPAGTVIVKTSVGNIISVTRFYDRKIFEYSGTNYSGKKGEIPAPVYSWENFKDIYVLNMVNPTFSARFLFPLKNNFQLGAGVDTTFSVMSLLIKADDDDETNSRILFAGGKSGWMSGAIAPYAIIGYHNIYVHAGYDFVFGALYIAPSLAIGEHLLMGIPISLFGSTDNPVGIAPQMVSDPDTFKIKYFQVGLAVQYVF